MRDYVWQLDVEYPDGAYYENEWMGRILSPTWQPDNWIADDEYVSRFGTEQFIWPSVRRFYLSRSSAVGRANLLEYYGARVRLLRSQPLAFEEREYKHRHRTVLRVVRTA
jgi:hypothetical protein